MKKSLSILATLLITTACTSQGIGNKTYLLQQSDLPITLTFNQDDNRFSGKAVNNYFGTYAIKNNEITLNRLGATLMMAPPHEMAQEEAYFKHLNSATTYKIAQNTLTITLENGDTLVFIEQ